MRSVGVGLIMQIVLEDELENRSVRMMRNIERKKENKRKCKKMSYKEMKEILKARENHQEDI